jgi:hypothetical protein
MPLAEWSGPATSTRRGIFLTARGDLAFWLRVDNVVAFGTLSVPATLHTEA